MKPSTLVAFLLASCIASAAQATGAIVYDAQQLRFTLQGKSMAYVLRVADGELVHEYWGAPVGEGWQPNNPVKPRGWRPLLSATQREFPDVGRGDLRAPAVRIINGGGVPLVAFRYVSY